MDGRGTMPDALESSLKRLAAAVDSLERAAERRMRHDEARANVEEEYALMQDDRSRLAVELDAALAPTRPRRAWTRSARGSRRSPSGWRAARKSERAACLPRYQIVDSIFVI